MTLHPEAERAFDCEAFASCQRQNFTNCPCQDLPSPRVGDGDAREIELLRKIEALVVERDKLRADDPWHEIAGAPQGVWLETRREDERGVNVTFWRGTPACPVDEREWIDREGRTTVTHGTFLPPTHWRFLPFAIWWDQRRRVGTAPQKEDAWRDIATAPKDGTVLLLLFPNAGHEPDVMSAWFAGDDPDNTDSGDWIAAGYARGRTYELPTHWQPLPAPPAASVPTREGAE